MVFHLWTVDESKHTMRILMNGDGPRTWGTPAGPRAYGDRNMEHGSYRAFQCACVTPCVRAKRRYGKYRC